MPDPGTSFRRAYQAVLDRTPPAPEWDQLGAPAPPARRRPPRSRSLPPWVMAGAAAALLLLVLGGAATLGLDRGPAPTTAASAPAADAPPATEGPSTTLSEFSAVEPPPGRLTVRRAAASSELSNFEAKYLIDGTDRAWNDESLRGVGAELTFTFAEPVEIDEIAVHHLTDPARFARNYRVAQLALAVDGEPVLVTTIPDEPGAHSFAVDRIGSVVIIGVLDVYPAESFGGSPPFEELAVAEVEFFGHPATP